MKPTKDPDLFRFGSSPGLHQSAPKFTDISFPQLRFWCRLRYIFTFAWAAVLKEHACQTKIQLQITLHQDQLPKAWRQNHSLFVFLSPYSRY